MRDTTLTAAAILFSIALAGSIDRATARAKEAASATQPAHWAFVPPARPAEPSVRDSTWLKTPVDSFVLARLEAVGIKPSAEADRATLIRRLSFDLRGLPPEPKEIEQFIADSAPGAYERLVERFLASPQYGVRWGGHWLQTVGYADSNGYFEADTDRPLAYKYRDYLVRSFNADKPFDQFVREQVAGDELLEYAQGDEAPPRDEELLTATHLFRNAPDGTGESDGNPQELAADRYAVLEGNVQILGSVFLGLTVQCARCHDHKFEPITQAEYYQLQAILKPAYDHDHWRKPSERTIAIGTPQQVKETRQKIQQAEGEIAALKLAMEGLKTPLVRLIQKERIASLPDRQAIEKALDAGANKQNEAMKQLLRQHRKRLDVSDDALLKRFPDVAPAYRQLQGAIADHEAKKPKLDEVAALTEPTTRPAAHHILIRGRYTDAGAEVQPGVPAILCAGGDEYSISSGATRTSGRRLALANWLTSPQNPMVARLMVNRIWQHHFGVGIVATPDNFGRTGERPSHPELLDYLATEFARNGWSIKSLHRLIVNSATYRQSSEMREDAAKIDPDDLLLWRFSPQRLDAEAMRDAMLAASGELDQSLDGSYVPVTPDAQGQMIVDETRAGSHRRSLYLQHRRTKPDRLLEVFDSPEMVPNCTRRNPSTVALQSLALLNSDFVRRRSDAFCRRVLSGASGQGNRIDLAFQLAYGRTPSANERSAAEDFIAAQSGQYEKETQAEQRVWTDLCQMLFAGNAFLYVD